MFVCSTIDIYIQVSADSGRGESAGVAPSTSPVANDIGELLQPLPIYEFEIPQTLVGLVIGVKGKTVKELQDKSNCRMTVRKNHQSARPEYQICTVEGWLFFGGQLTVKSVGAKMKLFFWRKLILY